MASQTALDAACATLKASLQLAAESSIDYWVKVPGERFYRYEIAGPTTPEAWATTARSWLGVGERTADWLEPVTDAEYGAG